MADDGKKQSRPGNAPKKVRWEAVASAVGTALAVLAFLGITDVGQLRQRLLGTTTSPTTTVFTLSPTPSGSEPTPSAEEDTPTPPVETPSVEGSTSGANSLDDSSTDGTPFTRSALMADAFTNSRGVRYKWVAGGSHGCTEAYAMTSDVRQVLDEHSCGDMTGDYQVDSATVNDNNDILVSVQVFAFRDSAAAEEVYNSFPKGGSWDFGVWCPLHGRGQAACTSGYAQARKRDHIRLYHRYLIEATALYTSLGSDISLQPWIDAAAEKAAEVCGPQNYGGG
ncbi:MAG TPA: hypothetical protein VF069_27975 [Streptosporangiaceae bacterium]